MLSDTQETEPLPVPLYEDEEEDRNLVTDGDDDSLCRLCRSLFRPLSLGVSVPRGVSGSTSGSTTITRGTSALSATGASSTSFIIYAPLTVNNERRESSLDSSFVGKLLLARNGYGHGDETTSFGRMPGSSQACVAIIVRLQTKNDPSSKRRR